MMHEFSRDACDHHRFESPPVKYAEPKVAQRTLEQATEFLKQVVFSEREVEQSRLDLALRKDFNLLDAFRSIAQHQLVIDALTLAGHFSLPLQQVQRYFAKNFQGKTFMSSQEFASHLLPMNQEFAQLVQARPPTGEQFSHETKKAFQFLWGLMVTKQPQFGGAPEHLWTLFDAIDSNHDHWLCVDDFRQFLRQNGFLATDRELQGLVRRLGCQEPKVQFEPFKLQMS